MNPQLNFVSTHVDMCKKDELCCEVGPPEATLPVRSAQGGALFSRLGLRRVSGPPLPCFESLFISGFVSVFQIASPRPPPLSPCDPRKEKKESTGSAYLLGEWVLTNREFRKMDLETESGRVDLPPCGFP